jgi:hypothetical protein
VNISEDIVASSSQRISSFVAQSFVFVLSITPGGSSVLEDPDLLDLDLLSLDPLVQKI